MTEIMDILEEGRTNTTGFCRLKEEGKERDGQLNLIH